MTIEYDNNFPRKEARNPMDKEIINALRNELKQQATDSVRKSSERFFKEPVKFYGVNSAGIRKIAKHFFTQIKTKSKQEIFAICEELLKSDYSEEAFIAFSWVYSQQKDYQPEDFEVFENWLNKYVNNWAKCDSFCNHSIGAFIEKYPEYMVHLKAWTTSSNRWVRRAAAVTLIVPAKKGKFLPDIFIIADSLLTDTDDMVQKGYGWMLKVACKLHEQDVFDYVMKNKKTMPRTALRYAIEKMPPELKRLAMAKILNELPKIHIKNA